MKWKLKSPPVKGVCLKVGCSGKTGGSRQNWCKAHKAAIRKEQMRIANVSYRKRAKTGDVAHRKVYDGKPTRWAKATALKSRRTQKSGRVSASLRKAA